MKIPHLAVTLAGALTLISAFSGCATTSRTTEATRSLEVVKTGNSAGSIKRVQIQEIGDRLYVSTTVGLGPFDHNGGGRVFVDLLDAKGQVIASDKDRLGPTPARHRSHTKQKTLHASFDLSLLPRASSVRVNYTK